MAAEDTGLWNEKLMQNQTTIRGSFISWKGITLSQAFLLVCFIRTTPLPNLEHIQLSGGSTFTTKILIYTLNQYTSIWFPRNKIQYTIWRIWRSNSGGYNGVRLLGYKAVQSG
jgi:hypothetical protein